jgi:hypothetical protein
MSMLILDVSSDSVNINNKLLSRSCYIVLLSLFFTIVSFENIRSQEQFVISIILNNFSSVKNPLNDFI